MMDLPTWSRRGNIVRPLGLKNTIFDIFFIFGFLNVFIFFGFSTILIFLDFLMFDFFGFYNVWIFWIFYYFEFFRFSNVCLDVSLWYHIYNPMWNLSQGFFPKSSIGPTYYRGDWIGKKYYGWIWKMEDAKQQQFLGHEKEYLIFIMD